MITYFRNKYYSYQIRKYLIQTLSAIYNTKYVVDGISIHPPGSVRRKILITNIELFRIEMLEDGYYIYIVNDDCQELICSITYMAHTYESGSVMMSQYINGNWDLCILKELKKLCNEVITTYNLKLKNKDDAKKMIRNRMNALFEGRCK